MNSMATAYEADIQTILAQCQAMSTKMGEPGKGLRTKDLRPEKFDSNKKSEQSFKQWADDLRTWLKRVDASLWSAVLESEKLTEWDLVKFNASMVTAGVPAQQLDETQDGLMDILKKFTKGDARDLVDTTSHGGEAWYRLHDRFYSRTVIGATSIANRLQDIKRPASLAESFALLTEVRGLVKEFQRQSPTEPMPTAMIKAAYMRVVPENYRKGLEMQVDVDRTAVNLIEDKVMQFIRSNSSGAAHMDVGTLRKDCASGSTESWDWAWGPTGAYSMDAKTWEEQQGHEHEESTEYGQEETWSPEAMVFMKGKGKNKGKGKGKTIFYGHCYGCGQQGHSQKFCPQAKGKGKGKDNNWQKGSFKGGQKGYGKGSGTYGKGMNYTGQEEGSGQSGLPALALERGPKANRTECVELRNLAEGEEHRGDAQWMVPVRYVKALRHSRKTNSSRDAPIFHQKTQFQLLMEADDEDNEDDDLLDSNIASGGTSRDNSAEGLNLNEVASPMGGQRDWRQRGKQSESRPLGILEKCGTDLCKITQPQWAPLPKALVVDSGAGETVLPSEWLPAHDVAESPGSRSNEYYTTADGNKVYNEGQKSVVVSCMDGSQQRSMTFQVAPVHKALGSVSQMVRNGNRVVFDADAAGRDVSFIQNKSTQEKMPMRLENGVYVVDLLVAPPDYRPSGAWNQDFARQG